MNRRAKKVALPEPVCRLLAGNYTVNGDEQAFSPCHLIRHTLATLKGKAIITNKSIYISHSLIRYQYTNNQYTNIRIHPSSQELPCLANDASLPLKIYTATN